MMQINIKSVAGHNVNCRAALKGGVFWDVRSIVSVHSPVVRIWLIYFNFNVFEK